MARPLVLALVLGVTACTTQRARFLDRQPGIVITIDEHPREARTERMLLVLDGTVVINERSGTVAPLRLPLLPSGEHTLQARIEQSFACGLGTSPRGKLVIRYSHTFVFEARQRAHVSLEIDEDGSVLRPIDERIHARWRASGDGVTEADGCDFGADVALEGCDVPPSRDAHAPTHEGRIFVLGEVHKPGSMTTWSAPTIAHAICRAGGTTVFASHRARVRRANVSFIADRDGHVALEPDDVVFVEPICAGY